MPQKKGNLKKQKTAAQTAKPGSAIDLEEEWSGFDSDDAEPTGTVRLVAGVKKVADEVKSKAKVKSKKNTSSEKLNGDVKIASSGQTSGGNAFDVLGELEEEGIDGNVTLVVHL